MRLAPPLRLAAVLGAVVIALTVTAAAGAVSGGYVVKPLVSDTGIGGTTKDPNLVNAWGLTAGPTTPWWVADNGTDTSTLYAGDGTKVPLTVGVASAPDGTVFNGSSDFTVRHGGASGPSVFLFATEN